MSIEAGGPAPAWSRRTRPPSTTCRTARTPRRARSGTGPRGLAPAAHRRRRRVRHRGAHRRLDADPVRHLGHQPRPGRPLADEVPDPEQIADEDEAASARKALAYMDLTPGTPLRDDRRRHRLPRLLHQRPHRGPARGGRSHPRQPRGRRGADARGARVDAGEAAGRAGGPGRGLHRGGRGMALRRAARCAWA